MHGVAADGVRRGTVDDLERIRQSASVYGCPSVGAQSNGTLLEVPVRDKVPDLQPIDIRGTARRRRGAHRLKRHVGGALVSRPF